MTEFISLRARILAKSCRTEAACLRVSCATCVLATWISAFADRPKFAIAFGALAVLMEFVAATMRRDAQALERLANLYETREGES